MLECEQLLPRRNAEMSTYNELIQRLFVPKERDPAPQ